MERIRRIVALMVATAAAGFLAGCAARAQGGPHAARQASAPPTPLVATPAADTAKDVRTVTGTATGRVLATPDTLTLTVGVQSRGASAREALDRNSDRAGKVIEVLLAAGVDQKDLQTSQLSINPLSDNSANQVTGYEVSNLVTAKVHKIGDAGKIIDAAVSAAGDDIRFDGAQFSVDDPSKLAGDARADAVKRARAQAEQLAAAAGVELGDVQSITETSALPGPVVRADSAAAKEAAGAPPVQPGTQELTVDVTVVFAIK
jgi:uncharacterized protein